MFYSTKLKKFKQIKHCFFSKRGGYSSGVYKALIAVEDPEIKQKM